MQDDGREQFLSAINVSRETLERLDIYAELLSRWTKKINLISGSTLASLWSRHFLDSAQLFDISPTSTRKWLDLGSGGGFPGLIVAALAAERNPNLAVELVESDIRKATFLRTAVREMGISVKIYAERIENLPPKNATIISARALAPLESLLSFAEQHMSPNGTAIFPKGEKFESEIATARKTWQFTHEQIPSRTDDSARILKITELSRV